MQFHEFIGQVQHRARLESSEAALRATRVTLETLAERLSGGEPSDLGAQLPREIAAFLGGPAAGSGERFSVDEFYQRVSEREGIDLPMAVFHARVVLDVLGDAVSAGEMQDVRAQLPADFQPLFEAGSEGTMPPAP